ncbi:hypothetical protein FRC03_000435 [Tulasnella sp. 419]|nr:hypothetical protein FRC02_007890 [Tulasnella sp. 418]KAG8965525.1 hypothetical protein FRC03_000435 [Tulasnella sp. 419]
MPASISDLPYELLVDQLLPLLPTPALLALTCTSKFFAEVCSDAVLWKRRLQLDFNFSSSGDTARTSGFKLIYKGMHKPKVYTWGESTWGRLGHDGDTLGEGDSIPYPIELKFDSRIVSLVSGGWSFHALDDKGKLHVWGNLHAQVGSRSPPDDPSFAEEGVTTWDPLELQLPARIMAITCSRRHSAALDSKNRVWMFTRWGRPNVLTFTGSLSDPPYRHPKLAQRRIVQVECGWSFTSFLTDDGHVYAIWPGSGMFAHQESLKNDALDQKDDGYPANARDGMIYCIPVEISAEPLLLPDLPLDLPHLRSTLDEEGPDVTAHTTPKLVKIAAGEYFIIGLTDQGHVLCIDLMGGEGENGLDDLRAMFISGERDWVYRPDFCDIRQIVKDPVYEPEDDRSPQVTPPKSLNITHISAHFNYFVAYSPGVSSTVLMSHVKRGTDTPIESITRTIPPLLQNQDVILVVLGDYHFGALHGDGTLSTWGAYSKGALGLGNPIKLPVGAPGGFPTKEALEYAKDRSYFQDIAPPEVKNPSPVRFDWDHPGRKRFCFAVAAFGWHTGALAIDLENYPDSDEEESNAPEEAKEEADDAKDENKPRKIALLKPLAKFYKSGESSRVKWKKLVCGCFGDSETTEG